jgi:ROK family protein
LFGTASPHLARDGCLQTGPETNTQRIAAVFGGPCSSNLRFPEETTVADTAPTAPPSLPSGPLAHGARVLPAVIVDTYNEELRDEDGFVGDRASRRAFRAILDDWRDRLKETGDDPLGETPPEEVSKSKLDKMMVSNDPVAAALVHTVVEEFAVELATVVRRFLRLTSWKETERIVLGGGLIASRIGELAMGRATILLKAAGVDIELHPIENHPDEAGLIGAVQLAPSWIMAGHEAILAVDIGGTNARVGVVELTADKRGDLDLEEVDVWKREHWRHLDDKPTRDEAMDRIARMLHKLIDRADKEKIKLAPFIGIGCPGLIDEHGTIVKGGQNLPGNWEGETFNLAASLMERLPRIGGNDIVIQIHNDAVVQGLSEVPNMKDVEHWGVMTIGTGLGNARFTNRTDD